MLPSSHAVPISVAEVPISAVDPALLTDPRMLADAFAEFISASAQLESSYRGLQQKVAHLSGELADRNAALSRTLAENDRIRGTLQQVIDSLPCGVLVEDESETLITINPEGRRLLGIEARGLKSLGDLSQASGVNFEALAGSQSDHRDTELLLQTASGQRWVAIGRRELTSSPGGQVSASAPLRCIWILRDVTVTRQAELEREASRRATALAEISSILAHEIRNPLASLELFVELIAEDPGGASQWIAHLRAGIRTLSGTVNNVLSMNGENNLRFCALDLAACARAAVDFVRPIAEQANVALSFHSVGEGTTIQGNEDGIRQIILNLTCNAIRHTPPEGRVDVRVRREDGHSGQVAVVEVCDSGCGIPEGQLERIFEAGFSGTGETPGLGLAVCARLMRQHRGTIGVLSRLKEGSIFRLEFSESQS